MLELLRVCLQYFCSLAIRRSRVAGGRDGRLMRTWPDTWRKLSIYIVIPCLLIASVNAWRLWSEHWEHKAHEPPVEEKTEYPFMNIRNKAFPWGDGDKVSRHPLERSAREGCLVLLTYPCVVDCIMD